jgi:nucleoside-diphosphate-sugar epimerase
MFTENRHAINQIYNTACSERVSLNRMIKKLAQITGNKTSIKYGPERIGDVKHSLASIQKASTLLGYKPTVYFDEGLEKVVEWYKQSLSSS